MLNEAGVTVLFDRRLREHQGVEKSGTRVVAIFSPSVWRSGAAFRRLHLRRRPDGAGRVS